LPFFRIRKNSAKSFRTRENSPTATTGREGGEEEIKGKPLPSFHERNFTDFTGGDSPAKAGRREGEGKGRQSEGAFYLFLEGEGKRKIRYGSVSRGEIVSPRERRRKRKKKKGNEDSVFHRKKKDLIRDHKMTKL